MTTAAVAKRSEMLRRLASESFDLVVVGGGITGAGVVLDAASRGLKTALVERHDFASGTSSRSSKLVHGGLRYLDQREFRLVYEALAERQVLLHTAPHLVDVQPFLFPVFARGEGKARKRASRAVAKAIGTALWLYDLTGGLRIGRRHHRISVEEALERFPALDSRRLASAYLYFDARADDARLTLSVIQTAIHRYDVPVVNYASAIGFPKQSGRISGVEVRDEIANEAFVVETPVVVNAAGVWSDDVRELDEGSHPGTLRPAKGVHITLAASKLPVDVAAVLPVPGDRRSIFVIPWGDRVYVGTTDTDYEGPLDEPVCTNDEIDYLLEALNSWIRRPLTADDVLGTWAGLRPLVKEAPSDRTADLSRRHTVRTSGSGLVTVTGGKLTTYRRMAEDTVDAALGVLGRSAPRSRTDRLLLHGAEGVDELVGDEASERLGVGSELARHLVGRYGDDARAVATMVHTEPELGEPLVPGLPYVGAEAVYAARYEMACTLEDVLARRTRALLLDREASQRAAPAVARLVAPELDWSPDEIERQVDAFSHLVEHLRGAAVAEGHDRAPSATLRSHDAGS